MQINVSIVISIYFFPLIFFLVYKDQKTGKIELNYWKAIFPFTFLFVLVTSPQNIFLILDIFVEFGIVFLIFLLFFTLIKLFGGADILFLIFLFFCATDKFLIYIHGDFLVFLNKLAMFVTIGMWNKGIFVINNQYFEKITNLCKISEFPLKNKPKSFFSPQFFFIFLAFF